MENGRYSTCDNHEHPHFYFMLTKGKARPQKNVVAGPSYLVIADVPDAYRSALRLLPIQ